MPFFPMPYFATVSTRATATDRSGQKVETGLTVKTEAMRCLFLMTSGGHKATGFESFEGTVAFYTEANSGMEEGDIITNIRNRRGVVVEAGPFRAENVKKTPNLSGQIHHLSCKLKGVAGA